MRISLARWTIAEFIGTAFLGAALVGSGIMADRLSGANVGLALFENTIATGAVLVALIVTFGPISGAHLNPVVTLMDALEYGHPGLRLHPTFLANCSVVSVVQLQRILCSACRSFPYQLMRHARNGSAQVFSEFVATFGLISVIWGSSRLKPAAVPFAVGAYITAAY